MKKTETQSAILKAIESHKKEFASFSENIPTMACFAANEVGKLSEAALAYKFLKGGEQALLNAEQAAVNLIAVGYRLIDELNKKK